MLNRLEMLRIFCVAAEFKNFKEAAVRLHMSPQAVTRAIQELEALSGEMLFHRNTRQTRITHVGAALAVRARQSVEGVDQLFQSFQEDQQEQVRGTVLKGSGRMPGFWHCERERNWSSSLLISPSPPLHSPKRARISCSSRCAP